MCNGDYFKIIIRTHKGPMFELHLAAEAKSGSSGYSFAELRLMLSQKQLRTS